MLGVALLVVMLIHVCVCVCVCNVAMIKMQGCIAKSTEVMKAMNK